jgi:hypothetical protein
MYDMESQVSLTQETGHVLTQIDSFASPLTSRAIALGVLTSPGIMADLFQARLSATWPAGTTVGNCRSAVLKRRLGSRQVIAYSLVLLNQKGHQERRIDVVGKRYADGIEGARAFRTMRLLWDSGFGAASRLRIPEPLGYFPDFKLLVQEKVRGVLMPTQLGRGNGSAQRHLTMAARWIAKLHSQEVIPDAASSPDDDEISISRFVGCVGERLPRQAARLEGIARALRQRRAFFKSPLPTLVHGDFHPENIFATRSGATVIDFDQFCLSDPARDLGYFLAQMQATAYRQTGSFRAIAGEIKTFLDEYFTNIAPEEHDAWAARIATYAAASFLEGLYYIICVVKDDAFSGSMLYLQELQRLIGVERSRVFLS